MYWVTVFLNRGSFVLRIAGHLVGAVTYALVWYGAYHLMFPLVFGQEA